MSSYPSLDQYLRAALKERKMNYRDLAKAVGVNYLVLKPYSIGTFSLPQSKRYDIDYNTMKDELLAVRDNFSKDGFEVIYRANAIDQESRPHQYEKCNSTPFMWVYFMADGRVFTCSAHLMDDRFCIGNIYNNTFQEIWEGEKRRQNWEMMRKTFDIKECRLNCRMNQSNIYLEQLKKGIPHQNFV